MGKEGFLSFTLLPRLGRYSDGGVGQASVLDLRKPCTRPPPLPDPGRGSEDLQLHLHCHLRLGVSFQTRGLWLPPFLPGQVTEERGMGELSGSRGVSPGETPRRL